MANTVISPNMNLPVPVVGTDAGPDWATNYNACLSAIDSHNHTTGQGVQITPAGININTDLPFGNNNLTTVRSVNFTAQGSPLALAGDLGCVYVSGVDLYYNDENGNQVRITQSGSVTGATGTITGLPSGTASASYSAGTFTFQGATNTPATMAVGPVVIGRAVASSKTVTLSPNSGQSADFGMTFPAALPGSTSILSLDASGNIASVATTGSGSVVLATAPTFAGVPTGTITADVFSPTISFSHTSGGTVTITQAANTWYYQRIGNVVVVNGKSTLTISAFSTNAVYAISTTIPISTATVALSGQFIATGVLSGGSQNLQDISGGAVSPISSITFNTAGTTYTTFCYMYIIS